MKKRMIILLAVVTLFLGIIGSTKYFQVRAAIEQGASFQPPPEAVTTTVAQAEHWPSALNAIGTVVAVQGVTVSADMPGIVQHVGFDSGRRVAVGSVLVKLDTRQEQAQLAAAEAQRDLAQVSFERMSGLRKKGVTSQAELDQAAAEAQGAAARVAEMRAAIERKTIRAPFSGLLGLRQVNLGQYLAQGDPVVSLQSLDPIYVNFAVPQQEMDGLAAGAEVRVTSEGMAGELAGKITAVDSVVDPATRNLEVQATLANPDGRLRPGMFVEARVVLGAAREVMTLPASAVSYAPYGDSVFIVEDLKDPQGKTYRGVRQQFVKLGGARGDQIAVLSGLKPGEEVVSSGAFKLRPGAAVLVDNQVQPANSATPRPEDS
jgi:membrane fusion protein (multidrug efflux system)